LATSRPPRHNEPIGASDPSIDRSGGPPIVPPCPTTRPHASPSQFPTVGVSAMDKAKTVPRTGLDVTKIIDAFGYVIYVALAILAWGVYNAIMLYRTLGKKSLPKVEAAGLIAKVRDLCLNRGD